MATKANIAVHIFHRIITVTGSEVLQHDLDMPGLKFHAVRSGMFYSVDKVFVPFRRWFFQERVGGSVEPC
jgi:hypothetical protein